MAQRLDYLKESASQTAGPYVHIGLAPSRAGFDIYANEIGREIAEPNTPGERIRVEGTVLDGTFAPCRDVLIEVWQADAAGIYPHPEDPRVAQVAPGFRAWGRVVPDFATGLWSFDTIKPGVVPGWSGRPQAPHISLWIVARGINIGLQTRLYFSDEGEANAADPVLTLIEQVHRRQTLIAQRDERDGQAVYRFDVRLQGEGETVFLDI